MQSKIMDIKCYYKNCNNHVTSREHAPPLSFFPKNMRQNLITVRSCNQHNSNKNGDDEYIRNIFTLSIKTNSIGQKLALDKTFHSFLKNPSLSKKTFSKIMKIENSNTIAFEINYSRILSWIKSLAYTIYRYDFKVNYNGDLFIVYYTSIFIIYNKNTNL